MENCPYCKHEIEINHDDGRGYEEEILHEQECNNCGKTFVFSTHISFDYTLYKADCLNEGGEHDWKPTITYPKQFTKMRCTMCESERHTTKEERQEHDIPERK